MLAPRLACVAVREFSEPGRETLVDLTSDIVNLFPCTGPHRQIYNSCLLVTDRPDLFINAVLYIFRNSTATVSRNPPHLSRCFPSFPANHPSLTEPTPKHPDTALHRWFQDLPKRSGKMGQAARTRPLPTLTPLPPPLSPKLETIPCTPVR